MSINASNTELANEKHCKTCIDTALKMKFSIKDFFTFMKISLMENFINCEVRFEHKKMRFVEKILN